MKTPSKTTKTTRFIGIALSAILAFGAAVTGAKPAQAAGQNDILGLLFGAAIGGIVGSNIGSGKGQLAATAAGTLIGASVGSQVASGGTRYSRPSATRTVYVPQRTTPTRIVYVPVRPEYRGDHKNSNHYHGRKWRRHGHVPSWTPPQRHYRGDGHRNSRRYYD
ncbi:MAG: glycine zipper 2TM domain-containing protein [Rhodospirillaceae bacterium]|jgi:hypothetical protein|nr:glycine zipper 2TM domain-containing protein [Rhodospirillaceae bacterium]MBT3883465.1 glycine zipper 2TM domain-containing protein [Rhodospirillaceae bacterium]MBT4114799.1 glycine zipper 2TM domain-containing protein [Rhodospirillaceae bacterium]MBT4674123.1 glycine zipper 2TM domain-containing protein [Rhodospirillaceae bacterium]MBT4721432.1 glycine zipper 2TM domain-containing protein [Rhodospirillaceae bacterium]